MKTQEEIEQLANQYIEDNTGDHYVYCGYIEGYTQCQEDMQKDVEYWQGEFDHWHQQAMEMARKKYTEEDLENAFNSGRGYGVPDNVKDFNSFINSLNKQDNE
jgi:hypothetical protein